MAKIFEVMSSDISIAGDMEFTVDNTVATVAVIKAAAANIFTNANGDSYFALGDNIQLLSVFINIPYRFGQAEGLASMGIVWRDTLNNSTIIPELAGNSVLSMPGICDALDILPSGLFIKNPTGVPGRVRMGLTAFSLNVSQLNVPVLINGAVLKVQVHLELLHTIPLTAVP